MNDGCNEFRRADIQVQHHFRCIQYFTNRPKDQAGDVSLRLLPAGKILYRKTGLTILYFNTGKG